jgi:hypothetical protein
LGLFNFFGLFSKKNESKSANFIEKQKSTPLPGTQLFYEDKLITDLKNDHQALLAIYGQIGEALENNNHDEIVDLFVDFSSGLRSHILKENLKLYVYLSHAMVLDTESLALIIELRSEMSKIGRTVNSFLTRYSELPWTTEKMASFPVEFKQIGDVLVERIEREESTLYPLYMHPEAYLQEDIF